jgi:hypothetical protein
MSQLLMNRLRSPFARMVSYLSLWIHLTTTVGEDQLFEARFLQICHASLLNTLNEFLTTLSRILSHTQSGYLEEVVSQLLMIEKIVREHRDASSIASRIDGIDNKATRYASKLLVRFVH